MRREHVPANTKTIGKIKSFTVSRCFISHIHSSNWVLPNNFENSNFVKNIFPVLHLLFLYKATLRLCSCLILETSPPDAAFSDWGFLFLILAFLYFYNFLFLFLHLGYFFYSYLKLHLTTQHLPSFPKALNVSGFQSLW